MSKQRANRRGGTGPIKREAVLACLAKQDSPCTLEELARRLRVADTTTLRRCLNAMLSAGEVLCNRRGGFGLIKRMDLVAGQVQAHPEGFGFLIQEDEDSPDLYLSVREMQSVLHGDRVIGRVAGINRGGRLRGALVEVVERANSRIAGQYRVDGDYRYVAPVEPRLRDVEVPAGAEGKARPQDHVIVELTRQPEPRVPPQGRVVELVKARSPLDLAMTLIAHAHELPTDWPTAVRAELRGLPRRVRKQDLKGREDLRALALVTIDGVDARDFDDAVYCEPAGQGWRLIVAIADVSYYVRPGTALDREAARRGTSVYFPTRVIPMLPELLSNELCSLVPGEDRLCMACELRFARTGRVLRRRFFPAVMRSAARLTYTEVALLHVSAAQQRRFFPGESPAALSKQTAALRRRHKRLLGHLQHLHRLYALLREHRQQTGLLEFDAGEVKLDFGPDDRVRGVVSVTRNDAHRLIEECMLVANVAAARTLHGAQRPALYRVHDHPPADCLQELRATLGVLGLRLGGRQRPNINHYAETLQQASQRKVGHLVQTLLLRSMPLAVYSREARGHFGLHFAHYAHFTSPIRRYPDLLVHRALRALQEEGDSPYSDVELKRFADTCSMTERRAEQAEREVVRWCKCDYLKERLGEVFDGVVTNVQPFGLFVELQGLSMDGLMHVTTLPADYYHYDRVAQTLRGDRRQHSFRMGQALKAKLVRVDVDNRRIDLRLAK